MISGCHLNCCIVVALPCELGPSCRLIQEAVVELHIAEALVLVYHPHHWLPTRSSMWFAVLPPLL